MNKIIFLLLMISLPFIIGAVNSNDLDGDGLDDFKERFPGDFDNDGLPDIYEEKFGLDLEKKNTGDLDNDGLSDLEEYRLYKQGIAVNPLLFDTDGDSYNDREEIDLGSNPLSKYDPITFRNPIRFLVPGLIFLLFLLIAAYFFFGGNSTSSKTDDKKKKSSFLSGLIAFLELLLGPNIKKEREKQRKEELEDLEKIKKEKNQKREENKEFDTSKTKVVDDEKLDPHAFLLRALNQNKKKSKINNVLELFEKGDISKDDELTFFKEKKTKQEIIDWLKRKKEAKKKIVEIIKEVDEQSYHYEEDIFEKLEELSKK